MLVEHIAIFFTLFDKYAAALHDADCDVAFGRCSVHLPFGVGADGRQDVNHGAGLSLVSWTNLLKPSPEEKKLICDILRQFSLNVNNSECQ